MHEMDASETLANTYYLMDLKTCENELKLRKATLWTKSLLYFDLLDYLNLFLLTRYANVNRKLASFLISFSFSSSLLGYLNSQGYTPYRRG